MFYCRSRELSMINKLLTSDKFELLVLYGRRRVGKTALIVEAVKEKKCIFFTANRESEILSLKRVSQSIFEVYEEFSSFMTNFESWDSALIYLFEKGMNEELILVIDEFPYLAEASKRLPSMLQNLIDQYHNSSKLKIILSGSSMSFMERQVLGYESPLYGRRTAQLKLKPFNYSEAKAFMMQYTTEEKLIAYSIFGGIPYYLSQLEHFRSLKAAVMQLFLTPTGLFFEEPNNLLLQELREPATYNSIIEAIAQGASKHNQISTRVGIDAAKCSKYLKTLIDLHIVKKEYPDIKKKKKDGVYSLEDPLFRFWYKYIPNNLKHIEFGENEFLWEEKIQKNLSDYMGLAFEEICKQYLEMHLVNNQYPWSIDYVSRWWGNNPIEKKQEEIDLVGWSEGPVLFGECKWRNEKAGMKIYKDLIRKSYVLTKDHNINYVIFSKSGFTKELLELEDESLVLIDITQL